ncbi:MAG: MotE family protein [Epsilonproteobacteria bacterium]|nr:MotE family protein [Campylobacterota bacterium]
MRVFLAVFLPLFVFAKVDKSKLINCYEIFEQKRAELEAEVEKIEEQRQAFIALKDASMNILKKKEQKVNQKLKEVNDTLNKIEQIKKQNEALVKKYKQILEEIRNANTSKLVQSYAKMRAGNAAKILQDMDMNTSLDILSKLSPKVLSKIFSKMDATKAAVLTERLKSYTPKDK